MYNKTQVINHLNSLVNYAVTNGKDADEMRILVIPLTNAINAYFERDFTADVESCIEAMIHAGIRLGIKYKGFYLTTSHFAPFGYDDVRKVVMWMNEFMKITNAEFLASIKEYMDGETASIAYQSSVVDEWLGVWNDAESDVTAYLADIFIYACKCGMENSMELLLESPQIESVPQLSEIARDIYIDRHYKEFIEFYGLDVYINGGLND